MTEDSHSQQGTPMFDRTSSVQSTRGVSRPETLRTLREWFANPELLVPPLVLIPRLVLEGRVTLLAAREKAGKSTLLGQAVATFSRGGEFLGAHCGPGRVLWYAIDEVPADAVRRLRARDADDDAVVIAEDRPSSADLEAHIKEFRPALVVIDTLTELLADSLHSDRDAMDMTRALGPHLRVLRRNQTAAVLVHHANKQGGEYRGSGQLGAMVDIIALLRIPGATGQREDDSSVCTNLETRRTLTVTGRGLRGTDRLHFDGTLYHIGDGSAPLRARIVTAVAAGPCTGNSVAKSVTGRRSDILQSIEQLILEGALVRDGAELRVP